MTELWHVSRLRAAGNFYADGLKNLNYWIGTGILAVIVLLFFGDCLTHYFAQEDFYALKHRIMSVAQLREAFWPSGPVYSYRPLGSVYFTLMYRFFGNDPFPYHLMNLLTHVSLVAVLHALGRMLFGSTIGFVAALIFLLAGVNFLPVYWVVNITQSLPALTLLTSFLLFILFRRSGKWVWHIMAMLFCFISVLLHEMVIFLPFMISMYLLLVDESADKKKAFVAHIPFYAVTMLYVAFRMHGASAGTHMQKIMNEEYLLAALQRLFLLWNLCFSLGEMIVLTFSRPKELSLHFYNYLFQGTLLCVIVAAFIQMRLRGDDKAEIMRFFKRLVFSFSISIVPLAFLTNFFFVRPYRLNIAAVGISFLCALLVNRFFPRRWILAPIAGYILLSVFSLRLVRDFDYESIVKRQAIARTAVKDMEDILTTHPNVSSAFLVRFDDPDIFPALHGGDAFETLFSPPVSLMKTPPQSEAERRRTLKLIYKDGHLWALRRP